MRIKEINIESFKGIDSLEFKPRLLNVIVGRNNTGKTSVLEAIAVTMDRVFFEQNYSDSPSSIVNYLVNALEINLVLTGNTNSSKSLKVEKISEQDVYKNIASTILERVNQIRKDKRYNLERKNSPGKNKNATKVEIHDEISIIQQTINNVIKDQLNSDNNKKLFQDCVLIKYNRGESTLFKGENFRLNEIIMTGEVIERLYKNKKLQLKYLLDYHMRHDLNPFVNSRKVKNRKFGEYKKIILVNDPVKTLNTLLDQKDGNQELALKIEEILKSDIILPNLKRFDFTELVFDTVNGTKTVKFSMMGEGFQTLVAILAILKSNENSKSVILLEEPEIHMHPGYVTELVKYISQISSSLKIQLFITTHSSDLIQSLFNQEQTQIQEFLKRNLVMLRLNKMDDSIIGERMTYKEAKESVYDLELDLRGI
ncbi:ATP-binding protein [Cuniculiplasma divulgatum]|jgi:predicted ATP-dependent endonuclease of OLD family|uniref:SMC domain protein n=1 Tax=Cuniculiplasma divulgatum TaxID=1673428 RepID=A0A1N5UP93_9ARCH|nr:ATP-binding protein [Cuniculiplasma divulgatum]MCI2413066.1 AAA family ATPase [Cuniculiplasma sp.]SIM62400.1 SMC domain protein [Cuniculiplasma divulgatum]